jgi:hypothetical protein
MRLIDYYDEDKIEREELAELQAEVIASKTALADFRYLMKYGPGRIHGLEMNLEKIYE